MNKKTIIFIGLGVLVAWLIIGLSPRLFFDDAEGRGTFGDMFGAVNALFSGLALAGVICAILLQSQELKLQREELKLTRDELRRTSDAQSSSADTLSQQYRLAERNTTLQAYTALLQSCNERINAERARIASLGPSDRRNAAQSIKLRELQGDVERLEGKIKHLINVGSGS